MTEHPPLRVALIGTSRRSERFYGAILRHLPAVELVSVWGRNPDSAKRTGELLGVPHYTDIAELTRQTAPNIGIVSVAYAANGEAGLMAVESGLHVLLETPIAHKLREADAIIAAAEQRGLKIEVAEQFHRRPMEQLKLKLIASGLFGEVYSSFSDFAGHGYHGISILRSYLGFERKPLSVTGLIGEYPLTAHWSRLGNHRNPRNETQEHALIQFEGGRIGVFHWTNVGYDSPLRWWRSGRFLAEKGMGITTGVGLHEDEKLSLLAEGGEAPRFINIERRWERTDGGVLEAMVAHTGDANLPIVKWENPFRSTALGLPLGHGPQWHDDEIAVASCIMSLADAVKHNTTPSYGALQGRLDQELILAVRQSAAQGGAPVQLPLGPSAGE